MICRELRIGASGFRSSWASIARNSFLRRSDSDRSAAYFRSASSSRFCSVMSRAIFEAPTTRPVVILEGGDGQGDLNGAPVLAHPHGVEVIDPFPFAQALENAFLLVLAAPRE